MAILADLPPELIHHIISFLVRENLSLSSLPLGSLKSRVPHFSSINALSQTNSVLYATVNEALYKLCARNSLSGRLALLFAVTHQLENTLDKFAAAGLGLDGEFKHKNCRGGILSIAVGMGLRVMVVRLLEMHGDEMATRVHARAGPSPGLTALDHAARDGHLDIVGVLAPIYPPPASPFSHIHYLSHALIHGMGNMEITQSLIAAGADVNFVPESSIPPLFHAVHMNELAPVQLLLSAGATPNGHGDAIPLFEAVYRSNLPMVRTLVDAGADIHIRNSELDHVLSWCTTVELLCFFLERGVDPNTADSGGCTALHFVCAAGGTYDERFVELLCQFEAVPERINGERKTAVDLAMDNQFPKFVRALEPFVRDPDRKAKISEWWEVRKQRKQPKPSVQVDNLV